MFCKQCGNEIPDNAVICIKCGVAANNASLGQTVAKSRVAYILLGIFLGGLGIHNFYAGYTGKGAAQLLITLLTGWLVLPLVVVGIWVLVEICVVTKDAAGNQFC